MLKQISKVSWTNRVRTALVEPGRLLSDHGLFEKNRGEQNVWTVVSRWLDASFELGQPSFDVKLLPIRIHLFEQIYRKLEKGRTEGQATQQLCWDLR